MTLPVLKKLRALVEAGGVIVGAKPHVSPSLTDDAAEFRRVADDIWGTDDIQTTEMRSFKTGPGFPWAGCRRSTGKIECSERL